jgi:hypothetical protein
MPSNLMPPPAPPGNILKNDKKMVEVKQYFSINISTGNIPPPPPPMPGQIKSCDLFASLAFASLISSARLSFRKSKSK